MSRFNAQKRQVVGRRIADFTQGAKWVEVSTGTRALMHDVRITLDNGRVLAFNVEEHPDGAFYGVVALISDKPKKE